MDFDFNYSSVASIVNAAEKNNSPISALILAQQAQQMEQSEEALFAHMRENFQVMSQCIEPGSSRDVKSTSGLTGGSAYKMRRVAEGGGSLTGSLMAGALYRALAVSELNASMGRIVAAPTAGSCGILPAALLTMQAEKGCPEHDCVMAMFTASAIGMVIANNASLAGAQGGCQAECGSAAAMAAGAIVELAGGTPRQVSHAVAIALKNILGLVCDPVAGLVEIPCIKRNVIGAMNAVSAADMALAGVVGHIPADEVIDAMAEVGNAMSKDLRETGIGGLAGTPTGRAICEIVTMDNGEEED